MKKFYTLLSVALAGTMMVSAAVRVTDAKPAAIFESKTIAAKAIDTTPVKVEKKAVARKAPAKVEAAEAAAISGEYLFKSYARDFDTKKAYWMNMSVPYVEVQEDNSVILEGFWWSTVVLEATYDPETSTITIPTTSTGMVPTTTGDKEIHFYVIDFDTMTPKDLVLTVDTDNRCLYWEPAVTDGYYDETLLVSDSNISDGSRIYEQMYDCSLNEINAIMAWAALDANGQPVYDAEGNLEMDQTYVYAAKEGTNLVVNNFLDYSVLNGQAGCFDKPVTFTIDNEAQTITAANQTMTWNFSDGDIVCNVCGIDESGYFNIDNPTVTFVGDEATLESGATITDFYTEVVGILFELDGDYYGQDFYEVELIVLEPLFSGESGIADVIANDNTNAPVEYFNLQGVKVENPAAGLYIRRQGNQATKVLVK